MTKTLLLIHLSQHTLSTLLPFLGKFALCQGEKDCTSASVGSQENYLMCPSGSKRYRDGFNNCEFAQCDDPRCEMEDYMQCPSPMLHVFVARDPQAGSSGCADYLSCPMPTPMGTANDNADVTTTSAQPGTTSAPACPQDVKECPDGQTLNRNPTNKCELTVVLCFARLSRCTNSDRLYCFLPMIHRCLPSLPGRARLLRYKCWQRRKPLDLFQRRYSEAKRVRELRV